MLPVPPTQVAFRQRVVDTVATFALTPEERAQVNIFSKERGGHGARGYGLGHHQLEIAWWVHPDRYGREASFLHEALRLNGTERILSIGCGPALHENAIAELHPGAHVTATDLDPKEIATAKEIADRMGVSNISHHACTAEELSTVCPPAHFDRVMSLAVLHDIPDLERAIEGIRRAMTDDGVFAFTYNPHRREAIFPGSKVLDIVQRAFVVEAQRPLVTREDAHELYGGIASTSEAKRNYALAWDAVVAVPK